MAGSKLSPSTVKEGSCLGTCKKTYWHMHWHEVVMGAAKKEFQKYLAILDMFIMNNQKSFKLGYSSTLEPRQEFIILNWRIKLALDINQISKCKNPSTIKTIKQNKFVSTSWNLWDGRPEVSCEQEMVAKLIL